ncbi:MAG TPA: branched-chain amino acid ABC transporter permease [Solirubrobacterales bacterium]|nr:branched-chain amino acid ABC transporter permease [Solirubrobacterales bacterium]
MTLPLGVTFEAFTDFGFWTSVGILAGTYVLFTLGLQLNVGYTGIVNFGQAGFMAIGAYAMGVLVVKADWSFWLALPTAVFIAIGFGLLVGLPSLRLRADYFAIATIAAAEIVRITALNLRDVTGGNQGLFGFDDSWNNLADQIESWLVSLGWSDPEQLFPLFLVVWVTALIATVLLNFATKSPWGRVLRAVREDEDAARALGKNTLAYKLQSLAIASTLGALAGFFVAINLNFLTPEAFLPAFTFIGYAVLVLGGLASYWGVAAGAIVMWTILEGTRFIDLPISAEREAAVRFMIVGLVLILLMAFRPQGMFGKKEEMVLGD